MPYATLEPIRDVLYSSVQGDAIEVDRRWVKLLTREIQAAEVTLVAELARADATVEQLLAMQPGDFIELDREPRIRATIGGVPLATWVGEVAGWRAACSIFRGGIR